MIATHGNIGELVITKKALIWGIGCAFFMSLTTIIPERLFHRYAAQTVTSFNLLFGGVAATLIVRPYRHVPVLDVKGIASLFLAILCGSLLAYMVYGVSIQKVGTSKASLYACAEIPAATVLSVLFLGSQFMWLDIVGFVLIVSTIFILSGAHSEKNLS